jgi:CRISPR/Cas system-associated endoribonuclease Cas2
MPNTKAKRITKMVINGLYWTGMIIVAANSPYFGTRVLPELVRHARYKLSQKNREERKKFYSVFHRLRNQGFIEMQNRGGQIYIYLTKEGKKKAGKYQIDDLEIKRSKKWDKKWRILIFDIKEKQRIKREALRGKIKELGLYKLQKSIWVCPYDFEKEMKLLRDFFGLTQGEMKLIVASHIEGEEDMKKHFGLA